MLFKGEKLFLVTDISVEIMQYRQTSVTSSSSFSLQSPPSNVMTNTGVNFYCFNTLLLIIIGRSKDIKTVCRQKE